MAEHKRRDNWIEHNREMEEKGKQSVESIPISDILVEDVSPGINEDEPESKKVVETSSKEVNERVKD